MRGWADRFAGLLDEARPGTRYGNLAIRGRLLQQIVDERLPVAFAARADLVGFSAGGNDILRVGRDPDEVAAPYEQAVRQLRAAGSRVLVFTRLRRRCHLVDLWSLDSLRDRRSFSDDRLHLSAEGHERVARLVASVVGIPSGNPEEVYSTMTSAGSRREDLHWAREHLLPWVGRRVRHQSSGDHVAVKRPDLVELRSPA